MFNYLYIKIKLLREMAQGLRKCMNDKIEITFKLRVKMEL